MLKLALQRATVFTALKIAVIVGLILNGINQGDVFLSGQFADVNWIKFGVTFLVPYGVSTYSSVATQLRFAPGSRAPFEADLTCKQCRHAIHVDKKQLIPDCDHCGGQEWLRR